MSVWWISGWKRFPRRHREHNGIKGLWRSHRHAKRGPVVAAAAVLERQIAAEGSFAVVTGEAIHAAREIEMLGRRGGTNLMRLRRAGRQSMTLRASKPFTGGMVGMTKTQTIRASGGWSSPVPARVVTDSAGSDLFSRLRATVWRVAGIALVVGAQAHRN